MSSLEVILLSILQGLTEFLPVSSSAHLILLPKLLGYADHSLAFDTALHLGSLLAVLIYFRVELIKMSQDFYHHCRGGDATTESRLAWAILWGTIPVGLIGLLAKPWIELYLRAPSVIAYSTIFFGLLLLFADRKAKTSANRPLSALNWRDVALIGCAQALALIPGTSRSGITLTAGLFAGLEQTAAARYSFLLSIPVIFLAAGLSLKDIGSAPIDANLSQLTLAVCLSAATALTCIHLFLQLLKRIGLLPFVIYRLALGGILLYY